MTLRPAMRLHLPSEIGMGRLPCLNAFSLPRTPLTIPGATLADDVEFTLFVICTSPCLPFPSTPFMVGHKVPSDSGRLCGVRQWAFRGHPLPHCDSNHDIFAGGPGGTQVARAVGCFPSPRYARARLYLPCCSVVCGLLVPGTPVLLHTKPAPPSPSHLCITGHNAPAPHCMGLYAIFA